MRLVSTSIFGKEWNATEYYFIYLFYIWNVYISTKYVSDVVKWPFF